MVMTDMHFTEQAPSSTSNGLFIEASGRSDRGKQRERNEDLFLIATFQRSMLVHDADARTADHGWFAGNGTGTLLMVADGMGGEGDGDLASRIAIQTIAGYLLNVMPWVTMERERAGHRFSLPGVREQLAAAVVEGDSRVKSEAAKPNVSSRMGTTLTLAYVVWPVLYIAHVGDSRCYLHREGKLTQLTTDHTLAQQMKERGMPEAEVREEWHHILWNVVGGDEQAAVPQIIKMDLRPADELFLCTDGLTKHVNDLEVLVALQSKAPPQQVCRWLIDRTNERGGSDNVTVIVARPQFQ
jgi:serine/threonine protein phosphatase PrpC